MGQRKSDHRRGNLRTHEKRFENHRDARQRQCRPVRPVRPAFLRPPERIGRHACRILPGGRLPAGSGYQTVRNQDSGQTDLPRRTELPTCRLQLYPRQLRARLPLSLSDREICP